MQGTPIGKATADSSARDGVRTQWRRSGDGVVLQMSAFRPGLGRTVCFRSSKAAEEIHRRSIAGATGRWGLNLIAEMAGSKSCGCRMRRAAPSDGQA